MSNYKRGWACACAYSPLCVWECIWMFTYVVLTRACVCVYVLPLICNKTLEINFQHALISIWFDTISIYYFFVPSFFSKFSLWIHDMQTRFFPRLCYFLTSAFKNQWIYSEEYNNWMDTPFLMIPTRNFIHLFPFI